MGISSGIVAASHDTAIVPTKLRFRPNDDFFTGRCDRINVFEVYWILRLLRGPVGDGAGHLKFDIGSVQIDRERIDVEAVCCAMLLQFSIGSAERNLVTLELYTTQE